jgi:amidase/6-aminohexanoate-cyclic-dimer hydrolase
MTDLPALYDRHDALGLAALVAAGTVTAEALLDKALARAERLNPTLNAIVHPVPEVAHRRIAEGLPRGAFHGVPFLLKDSGAEGPDYPSSGGSRLTPGRTWQCESALLARLHAAGLVPFARTTAPEGSVGVTTEAAAYGGPTRNPWALDHTPGGSSGGAAAAVAAGIVPAAHGSDGGGSIRIPASCCGVFGMKPTRGRLPDGPYSGEGWAGMAVDGFLTRTVRDTAALLDACAGPDLGAPYWAPPLASTHLAATARPPRRLRIAVTDRSFAEAPVHAACREAVDRTATLLSDLGHEVETAAPKADHHAMMVAWTRIVACGTALWVREASGGAGPRAGEIEPVTAAACRFAATLSGADYLAAVETIHDYGRQMAVFFERFDALVTPVLAEPPARLGRFAHDAFDDFERYRLGADGIWPYSPFTAAFNASGQPAASLPLHWTAEGLPVGVQVAMPFGADLLLLSLAAEIEAAQPWFDRRPELTPAVSLT